MTNAKQIAAKYGVSLINDPSDAPLVTNMTLPIAEARALESELTAAGIEASYAPDNDDRTRAWVYATVEA